VTFCKIRK
jgi:hypothetical protein